MAYRVLIVDDREPSRQQIMAAAVTNGFDVIAECGDVDTAQRVFDDHAPEVVILDLHLDRGKALVLAEDFVEAHPRTLIVASSNFGDSDLMQKAFDAGVHRCLRKPLRVDEIHRLFQNLFEELSEIASA